MASSDQSSAGSSQQTPAYSDLTIVVGLLVCMSLCVYLVMLLGRRWRRKEDLYIQAAESKPKDKFQTNYGYSWDVVLVFKYHPFTPRSHVAVREVDAHLNSDFFERNEIFPIVFRLHQSGFECAAFYSIQADEVYVKIRAPVERLLEEAERIEFKLLYDEDKLKHKMDELKVDIPMKSPVTHFNPYHYIYDSTHRNYNYLFKEYLDKKSQKSSILKDSDRIKLIMSIIGAPDNVGGCGLSLEKMKRKNKILGYFPLHNYHVLEKVTKHWLRFMQSPWNKKYIVKVRGEFMLRITASIIHIFRLLWGEDSSLLSISTALSSVADSFIHCRPLGLAECCY